MEPEELREHLRTHHHEYDDSNRVVSAERFAYIVHGNDHVDMEGFRVLHRHTEEEWADSRHHQQALIAADEAEGR